MDPYAPKPESLEGMSSFRTKSTKEEVQAGQWWRLGDLPDVDLVGDGGEARAVKIKDDLNEDKEVLFRVNASDWVVQTAPEVFEKFTNQEFNKHFEAVVHASVIIRLNKPKEKVQNGSQEINREIQKENNIEEEKNPTARIRSGEATEKSETG